MPKTPAQLDRDITEALSRPADAPADHKTPLYGHTSETSAYLVDDYPYGFHERTQIRYWLEARPKKGWRFVSQTMNPKTRRWNKPKPSTYIEWAAAMYLDDKGHVHWDGVGPYSDDQKVLAFVTAFPAADMSELRRVVPMKLRFLKGRIAGSLAMTINGVKQPMSANDVERARSELSTWEEIGDLLGSAPLGA